DGIRDLIVTGVQTCALPISIGVIGTGFWGENQVRVLRQSRMADLVAICDTNEKRAREIGTKYGVPWHTDVNKFLRVPKLEAVNRSEERRVGKECRYRMWRYE